MSRDYLYLRYKDHSKKDVNKCVKQTAKKLDVAPEAVVAALTADFLEMFPVEIIVDILGRMDPVDRWHLCSMNEYINSICRDLYDIKEAIIPENLEKIKPSLFENIVAKYSKYAPIKRQMVKLINKLPKYDGKGEIVLKLQKPYFIGWTQKVSPLGDYIYIHPKELV